MRTGIYKTLRDRILFLEYQPGLILNEKRLADEFGVSRTPLREVLYRLEWEKLVRVIPRTGTLVTEIELPKLKDAFQVRFELERQAGALAAQGITGEQLATLGRLRDECREMFAERRPRNLVRIDLKFRRIIYEAAGNPILTELSDHLYNITVRVWYMVVSRVDWSAEVQGLLDELTATIEVLESRDADRAGELRREFLVRFVERVKGLF